MMRYTLTFLVVLAVAGVALAQGDHECTMPNHDDSCCAPGVAVAQTAPPASQPDGTSKLPPGHPPVGGTSGQLPPGHPPMGGGSGQLPPGHPQVGGQMPPGHPQVGGQMPAGHPQVGGGTKAPPLEVPTTQAESVSGTLMVTVVQGTKDGPDVKGDTVKLEMSYYGKLFRTYEAKLNASGRAVFNDVPVGVSLRPKVTIEHQGREFPAYGETMSPKRPDLAIRMKVYETTEQMPQIEVVMHHAIVKPLPDRSGYAVQEKMIIENKSDRVWIGKVVADGKRQTLPLTLPESVEKREEMDTSRPLYPGQSRLELHYVIPLRAGQSELVLRALAPTASLAIIKTDEADATVTPLDMEKGDQMNIPNSGGVMTFYVAKDLKAGQKVGIRINKAARDMTGGKWTSGGK